MSTTPELDVETINAVLRVLDEELHKYTPGSDAALALWALKERLSQSRRCSVHGIG